MPIDDSAAQDALDRLLEILPAATARVSSEMADEVRLEARANLKDPLGPLAESIHNEGPDQIGATTFQTKTGPTLVYSRQRELGGEIFPRERTVLTAAFRDPGYWTWDYGDGRGERDVFTTHVFQVGQHYLKRGVELAMPTLLRIAARIWADALRLAA